jgi:hypothetical protein
MLIIKKLAAHQPWWAWKCPENLEFSPQKCFMPLIMYYCTVKHKKFKSVMVQVKCDAGYWAFYFVDGHHPNRDQILPMLEPKIEFDNLLS